jgi:hypothetical protein
MINVGKLSNRSSAGKTIQRCLGARFANKTSQTTPFEDITAELAGESYVVILELSAPVKWA